MSAINKKIDNNILSSKQNNIHNKSTTTLLLEKKSLKLQEIIRRTILSTYKYKKLEIISPNDTNQCVYALESLFVRLFNLTSILKNNDYDKELFITKLQDINNELSILFKTFGTESFDDLITICLGSEFINKTILHSDIRDKWELIKNYCHPISYKVLSWKSDPSPSKSANVLKKTHIIEDINIVECGQNLDCFDLARTSKQFQTRVSGVKISIQHHEQRKTLIICAIVDDILLTCLNFNFVQNRLGTLIRDKPNDPEWQDERFDKFIESLTLKELLIYNNDELYHRFIGYISQVNLIKQKPISQVVKEFACSELYNQRTTLIELLLCSHQSEFQYLAYLLYDLLSDDTNNNIDTHEQTLLFDSLPWSIKRYFKDAMKRMIQYTNDLSNFDSQKIPLEQQICLMKAPDNVKEKAMLKLKEVKSKSDDSGSKARQYLDGLLKIPFGAYREEPILLVMSKTRNIFIDLITKLRPSPFKSILNNIPDKEYYTGLEVRKYTHQISDCYNSHINEKTLSLLQSNLLSNISRLSLTNNIILINKFIKSNNLHNKKLTHSGKTNNDMSISIQNFLNDIKSHKETLTSFADYCGVTRTPSGESVFSRIGKDIEVIDESLKSINHYMLNIKTTLNSAVFGHEKAKRQVERIIGQWINGEKTGYCFGFEGPPGVGKTSLAKKGIAKCLEDSDGTSRPFAFIAIGGSSNGSTLEGHNYTYVASTWGRIVDILMEKKCMNPIIFIDELDKVSKTEHGKEIIGILTHLIDPTQNDNFQDKYFNGIDLDLSKALFIFSYNDVDAIDRILLDRIHRVKFNALSLEDKLTITREYILPEVLDKMGLKDMIMFEDNVIEFIIEHYTNEPGVRKLKELLFEIVGEFNLASLGTDNEHHSNELPIHISCDDVKNIYLKDRDEVRPYIIHKNPAVGTINGLYANSLGKGGVLPIEARFFPSSSLLDLHLTGMQGDVMKESMRVAKTLAFDLVEPEKINKLFNSSKKSNGGEEQTSDILKKGIHIHVPEGAIKKDGPSAGTAITLVLISLLTNTPIRNDLAVTGEICLRGNVTAIGGLDLKILGGIKAGVKIFLYPKENQKEFDKFWEQYGDKQLVNGIVFHAIETIEEAMKLAFIEQ